VRSKTASCRSALVPGRILSEPKIYAYSSFDKRRVSGFLYLPKTGSKPYKTIVFPHGGPEAQSRAAFSSRIQFYAANGWAVFAPNFRGSTGYGAAFRRLIYKDWGGGHYQDVLEGTRQLIRDGIADPRRVSIVGGSFGGYSVLWALTQDPDFWKAGVDVYGVANLEMLARHDPPEWKEWMRANLGDPDDPKDREFMLSRSPITHAHRIQSPLLVFQGAKDFRVRQEESDQIVEALRRRGVPVDYVLYPDEGHGWSRKEHLFEELEKTVAFLERHAGEAFPKSQLAHAY